LQCGRERGEPAEHARTDTYVPSFKRESDPLLQLFLRAGR
jgi:hypothetical protein